MHDRSDSKADSGKPDERLVSRWIPLKDRPYLEILPYALPLDPDPYAVSFVVKLMELELGVYD